MSTELLSDYNVSGQKSAIVSRRKQYSDLDLSLIPHPNKKDIIPLTDMDAIKNAVKNLILTSPYERPFQPELGSMVKSLLFENSGPNTEFLLVKYIKEVLENYEPRIDNIVVEVEDDSDNNAYYITVLFNIINVDTTADVKLYLERLR